MENEKLTPQQQREKILRDALWKMGDCLYFDDRMAIYRNALAEAAAISDVPKCPNCGPLGNDFCTWKGHWTMDSGSIPDAPVAAKCPTCWKDPETHHQLCKPAPSRAELIGLMCVTAQKAFNAGLGQYEYMTRVLDALIKAGAVKL